MTIRLYAMTCGWLTLPLGAFLEGEKGEIHVPVPSYLIDHPKGKVLFDSGMNPAAWPDSEAYLEGKSKYIRMTFAPGEEVSARLQQLDTPPDSIRYLINSHLHFDHVGGNAQIPNAAVFVQRREWEAGRDSDLTQANGFMPKDYDLGHDVKQLDGEHDLFGDGAVVCIPTHGHTPGHQSLRVRLDSGDVLLAADACYLCRSLDNLHLPRTLHDAECAMNSLKSIRDMQKSGVRIFYGHDPDFWADIPQAPVAIT